MKKTNIGVQFYLVVLLLAALGFYVLHARFQSAACLILSVLMWTVILSESGKNK